MRILVALLVASCGAALAQVDVRGDVVVSTDALMTETVSAAIHWTLAAHVDAAYDVDGVSLRVVLDPSVRVAPTVTWELGLTEAFALTTIGATDVSAGIERLPLETARLGVPFGVEAVDVRGVRFGVPGVRIEHYRGDWRWRGALLHDPRSDRIAPLFSARATFEGFDVEAHVLFPRAAVFGLGGTGVIGRLVVYGEVWVLSDPLEARAVLGAAGTWSDGGWTVEAGYLPPGGGLVLRMGDPPTPLPTPASRPTVNGQWAWTLDPYGDRSVALSAGADLDLDTDSLNARAQAVYTAIRGDDMVTLSMGGAAGSGGASASLGMSIRTFF
jgi:hypothetical protein